MKLSPQERSERRAAFHRMDGRRKAEYIIAYYKAPILIGAAVFLILCSALYRQATKKEAVLYAALINLSVGETLENTLTTRFIERSGANARKTEVYLYRGLYLSDDAAPVNHEYAYASRLKLLGAVNAKQLDLVLMNREGYDILSRSGYLLELSEPLRSEPELLEGLSPYLAENTVILEDNATEYNLNEAMEYREIAETAVNAVIVSALPSFRSAGFSDDVYLGVVANTDRSAWVLRYLRYLADDDI